MHDQANGSLPKFKQLLKEADADFPDAFLDNLDRIIKTMKPAPKVSTFTADDKASHLPGLALADDPNWRKKREQDMAVADDMMAELEGLAGSAPPPTQQEHNDSRHSSSRSRHRSPPTDRHRRRHRSRSPSSSTSSSRRDHRPSSRQVMDDEPVLYKIYDGQITNIRDFGAFVRLEGIRGGGEGLVHIGQIAPTRIEDIHSAVHRQQLVKVKVISINGRKVGLSMKEVDQHTGQDLNPQKSAVSAGTSSNATPLRSKDFDAIERQQQGRQLQPSQRQLLQQNEPRSAVKRMSSPERWEIKQLIASGAVNAADYPGIYEDLEAANSNPNNELEAEEEVDVEVREDEPPFLRGQTRHTLELSPVKVVKVPDGTMNRSALAGAALAKERRELRQQQQNEEMDAVPKDVNTPWLDPMPEPGERQFAQDLRGVAVKPNQVAEWKQKTFNSATSFGKITSLSIQEQRESLPIYKLRTPLVQAIREVSSCVYQLGVCQLIVFFPL